MGRGQRSPLNTLIGGKEQSIMHVWQLNIKKLTMNHRNALSAFEMPYPARDLKSTEYGKWHNFLERWPVLQKNSEALTISHNICVSPLLVL